MHPGAAPAEREQATCPRSHSRKRGAPLTSPLKGLSKQKKPEDQGPRAKSDCPRVGGRHPHSLPDPANISPLLWFLWPQVASRNIVPRINNSEGPSRLCPQEISAYEQNKCLRSPSFYCFVPRPDMGWRRPRGLIQPKPLRTG